MSFFWNGQGSVVPFELFHVTRTFLKVVNAAYLSLEYDTIYLYKETTHDNIKLIVSNELVT